MKLSYGKAINLALKEAMEEDESVFYLGVDIAKFGGAYGATQGLLEQFGPVRVRDTPISEGAIVGMSVGAASQGLRPIVELMHMDFATCAMDQLVNQAAKMRYMFGGAMSIPMVVRCPVGGYLNAAAQHSQSLEAWFAHVPGLKVMTAGTPRDVRAVTRAAIRDDNPVILLDFIELYESTSDVPEDNIDIPEGGADIKRVGEDITIVTWGGMVPRVMEAASILADEGISCEVIDLLSLVPWDVDKVLESVARTGRAAVVHLATTRAGFGAEISATITERGFSDLKAPIIRVGARNAPVPYASNLENHVLPNTQRIVDAVRKNV